MHRRLVLAQLLHIALIGLFSAFMQTAEAQTVLKIATTTSTENSGLLKTLLPQFESKYNIKVNVISVGTGKAIKLGEAGDVDVVLVHARPLEDAFVASGQGIERRDVMYNDFIVVGPESDPAGLRGTRDVLEGFRKLSAGKTRFISRGDNSGTDMMEKGYWQQIGFDAKGKSWYVSAGLGMGEVLNMAAQMQGYALTDRATYGAYKAKTGLIVSLQGDERMFNPYGIIAVNPAKHPGINHTDAMKLIHWITSKDGQNAIAAFRVDGEQLFFPLARK